MEVLEPAYSLAKAAERDLEAAARLPREYGSQRTLLVRRGTGRLVAAQLLALGATRGVDLAWLQELLHRHPTRFYEAIVKPRIAATALEKMAEILRRAGSLMGSPEQLCSYLRMAFATAKPEEPSDWLEFTIEASELPIFIDSFLHEIRGSEILQKTHDVFRDLARYCMLVDLLIFTVAAYQDLGPATLLDEPDEETIEEAEGILQGLQRSGILSCTIDLLNGCREGCRCGRAVVNCQEFCNILVCTDTARSKTQREGGGGEKGPGDNQRDRSPG